MLASKPLTSSPNDSVVDNIEESYNDPYDKMMSLGDTKLPSSENNIFISFNKRTKKIVLKEHIVYHDDGKTDRPEPINLGMFDYLDIVKNISCMFDTENKFLPDRRENTLSKNMVGYVIKDGNNHKIFIHNINSSPIMGDIEILIRINECLKHYEDNELNEELAKVDSVLAYKIKKYVKLFIYTLLGYTITLISDNYNLINEKLKNSFTRYLVVSTYRIASYSQDLHTEYNVSYNKLKENIKTINGIKQLISKKLTNIDDQIKTYNIHLQNILKFDNAPESSRLLPMQQPRIKSPVPYYKNPNSSSNTNRYPINIGGGSNSDSESVCSSCNKSLTPDNNSRSHSYISEMYNF